MIATAALAVAALQSGWDPRLQPLADARLPTTLKQEAFHCGAIDLMDRQDRLATRFYAVRQRISAQIGGDRNIARYLPPLVVPVSRTREERCKPRGEINQWLDRGESAILKLERSFPAHTPRRRK